MAMTESTPAVQGQRKTKVGRVVSDKMDKTIVVSVERLTRHRLYKRVIRLTTKFKAHDEDNDAHVGDTVRIEESRPLSATKRWRLVEVVQRAGDHGALAPRQEDGEDDREVLFLCERERFDLPLQARRRCLQAVHVAEDLRQPDGWYA